MNSITIDNSKISSEYLEYFVFFKNRFDIFKFRIKTPLNETATLIA